MFIYVNCKRISNNILMIGVNEGIIGYQNIVSLILLCLKFLTSKMEKHQLHKLSMRQPR